MPCRRMPSRPRTLRVPAGDDGRGGGQRAAVRAQAYSARYAEVTLRAAGFLQQEDGPKRGRVRHHRLGHACQRGRRGGPARRPPGRARYRPGDAQAGAGTGLGAHRGVAGDRVRAHGGRQRYARHRSRHRRPRRSCSAVPSPGGVWSRTGRDCRRAPSTRAATSPRHWTCAVSSRASSQITSASRRGRWRRACSQTAARRSRCAG